MITSTTKPSGPSTPVNPLAAALAQLDGAVAELKRAAGHVSPPPEVTRLLLELAEADEACGSDFVGPGYDRWDRALREVTNYARVLAGMEPR